MEEWSFHNGNVHNLVESRRIDIRQDVDHGLLMQSSLIRRLLLEQELEGCVNAIAWNSNGSLLISGSDDARGIPDELVFSRAGDAEVEVGNPNVVWNASEDGTLRQHDFREGTSCPSAGSSQPECCNVLRLASFTCCHHVGDIEKCRMLIAITKRSLEEGENIFHAIEACNDVLDGHGSDIGPTPRHECFCPCAALLLKRKWENDGHMAIRDSRMHDE